MHNYSLPSINNHITKSDIKTMADNCITEISDNGSFISAIESLSKMELLIKEIKSNKKFVEYATEEIAKYGKSINTPSGTKIELAEVGTKYDYSKCNDDIYNKLSEQLAEIENALDERKAFLKTLPSAGMDVITVHGEMVKIYPPSKSSTSSFKTSIAK